LGLGRIRLDLSTETANEDPQVVELVPILGPPDPLQQDRVGHEFPRVGGELFEETVFGRGEADFLAVDGYEAPAKVNLEPLVAEDPIRRRVLARPPQQRAYPRQQFITTERL